VQYYTLYSILQYSVCYCVCVFPLGKKIPIKNVTPLSPHHTTIICHNDHYVTGQRCVECSLSRSRHASPSRPFSRWRAYIYHNIIYICIVWVWHSDVMMDARLRFRVLYHIIDNTYLPFDDVQCRFLCNFTSNKFVFLSPPWSSILPKIFQVKFPRCPSSFSWSIGFSSFVFNKWTTYTMYLVC